MRILLVAINAKYIHSNLAVYSLKASAGALSSYVELAEFTINHRKDEILREIGDWRNMGDVVAAGKIAVRKLSQYFDEEITFNQETTLCGKSILNNIDKAKKRGYFMTTQ